jgi:subfamily B ATP-binding cassette protein MsbA
MQQTSPKQDSSLKIYLRLLSYLRPFIGLFAVSIVGYMIFASSQPMLAAVLKYFVDGLGAPPETTYHPFPLIVRRPAAAGNHHLLAQRSAPSSATTIWHAFRWPGQRPAALPCSTACCACRTPISTSNNSGHLISRITYNVTMVTGAATDAIKVVIREGLTVVFLFGYLLWMNWKLTLVMVAILPIIGSW